MSKRSLLAGLLLSALVLSGCSASDPLPGPLYLDGTYYYWDGAAWQAATSSSGNVTTATVLGDNVIIRGDGGGSGVQGSQATISDFGSLYTPGDINTDSDINAGNDVNITNDLDVTDDASIGGILDMTNGQINNVADPTLAQGAATKNYVDTYSAYGELYISSSIATTCTLANTFYLVSGNTTSDELRDFTATGAGRLTYSGAGNRIVLVIAAVSARSDTNNVVLSTKVYKNGAAHPASTVQRKIATAGDIGAFSLASLLTMTTNDYIEIYIAVDNAGTQITFTGMDLTATTVD